jgi:hypothetical protein
MTTDDDADLGGIESQDPLVLSEGSSAPPPPADSPKIDLRDPHAVRRELAAVYRDMRANRIQPTTGTRLAYVLDLLRRAFETGDLQDRLETLERTLAVRKRDSHDNKQRPPRFKAL